MSLHFMWMDAQGAQHFMPRQISAAVRHKNGQWKKRLDGQMDEMEWKKDTHRTFSWIICIRLFFKPFRQCCHWNCCRWNLSVSVRQINKHTHREREKFKVERLPRKRASVTFHYNLWTGHIRFLLLVKIRLALDDWAHCIVIVVDVLICFCCSFVCFVIESFRSTSFPCLKFFFSVSSFNLYISSTMLDGLYQFF